MWSGLRRTCRMFVFVSLSVAAPLSRAEAQAPPGSAAASAGTVSGRVLAASGQPVTDAHVEIVELGRRVETDTSGGFRFEAVPPGAYILQAQSARAGMNVARVEVAAGQAVTVEVTLDRALHQETVVVTATPGA